MRGGDLEERNLVLSDLVNRVLDVGVVITGHVMISIADIDLISLDLRLLITSIETAAQKEFGVVNPIMPTHLYCLLPAPGSVTPPPPVRAVAVRAGIAWVSDADSPRLSRDARDAARATLEHDRVVSVALEHGVTPVPASLADPYLDDADMTSDVDAHTAGILAALPALAGMVEMTTIIAIHDQAPATGTPNRGRAYLEQLRSLPDRAADVAGRVELGMARFSVRKRAEGGRVALSHLIPRTAEQEYRATVSALAGDGFRVVVDGPRAPYSFGVFAPRRGLSGGMILAT